MRGNHSATIIPEHNPGIKLDELRGNLDGEARKIQSLRKTQNANRQAADKLQDLFSGLRALVEGMQAQVATIQAAVHAFSRLYAPIEELENIENRITNISGALELHNNDVSFSKSSQRLKQQFNGLAITQRSTDSSACDRRSFDSRERVDVPEQLSDEEKQELRDLFNDFVNQSGEDHSDSSSDTDSVTNADESDLKGNLNEEEDLLCGKFGYKHGAVNVVDRWRRGESYEDDEECEDGGGKPSRALAEH